MFGETDFFKREPADKLVNDGILKNARVMTLADTGHHAYIDNTKGLLEGLLKSYFEDEVTY